MVRFYHLEPRGLLETPGWLLGVLWEHLPRLEARELHQAAIAALMPNLKPAEQRRQLRKLRTAAQPRMSADMPADDRPAVQDPAAARDWFEAQGIKVVGA
ncbi:MAG: hypothetical protein IT318_24775 [Anaerolineales bacterium]|nr:hypothetical protein [Anaerolineales bacterium]